jgi:hypothetical protein
LNPETLERIKQEQAERGWTLDVVTADGQMLFSLASDPIKKMVLIDPDTGMLSPGSSSGNWVNDSNAYANDGATTANENNLTQVFRNFGVTFSGTVSSIDGIIVRVRAIRNGTSGNANATVDISYDGASHYTGTKTTDNFGSSITDYDLGGATDNWGRTWAKEELDNTNFHCRVKCTSSTSRKGRFDWIAIQVYYTAVVVTTQSIQKASDADVKATQQTEKTSDARVKVTRELLYCG